MKIVRIFASSDNVGLYAFKFTHKELQRFNEASDEDVTELHEIERIFSRWTDVLYLRSFFKEYAEDLLYFGISIEAAILQTIEEAFRLEKILLEVHPSHPNLENLFRNLDDRKVAPQILEKQKAKRIWLRLYALRIDSDQYVITGGAIKLTKEMKDRDNTRTQLLKLELCRQYLVEEGVFDKDSFIEFLEL